MLAALFLSVVSIQATALSLEPETACGLLAEKGLSARGGYNRTADSHYLCASRRKPLLAGGAVPHEIRFTATGDEAHVDRLTLELDVRTREDIQRGHRLMTEYATALTQRGLGTDLPSQVNDAILSATNGNWTIDGSTYTLRRQTQFGPGYQLILTIE